MSNLFNWVAEEGTPASVRRQAEEVLRRVKRQRYGRGQRYRLVKIADIPLTYKEVPIEDNKNKTKQL